MRKNKLLLLLALLMTAATGAWATDYTTLAVGDVIKVGDTFSPTADGAINNNGVDNGKTYTLIRADIDNDYNVTEKTDGAYYVFKYVSIMSSPYIHFEKAFEVTAISDGLEVTKFETVKGYLFYTLALHESAAASGYTVSLKDGVKDADKWTISPNPAEEGQTVTLQYNGRLKVKSVKAVKKAAPAYTMAAAATTSDKGKLICTAGHIHVYGEDAACTAGRVAKIIYVGPTGHATYNNGLALALEDMSTDPSTLFTWDKSGANNDGKTAAELCSAWNTSKPVTDAEWLLASKDQWNYMLGTNGAGSYTALRDGFESVGGSNLVEKDYWSSTEINDTQAWMFNFGYDWWYDYSKGTAYPQVRACLAF